MGSRITPPASGAVDSGTSTPVPSGTVAGDVGKALVLIDDDPVTTDWVTRTAPVRWASGRYYRPFIARDSSLTLVAGTVYYTPLWVPFDGGIDRIACRVLTPAVSTIHVGVMADTGGRPGARIAAGAGTLDGNSATVQEATISLASLVDYAPIVWLALVAVGGTPAMFGTETPGTTSPGVPGIAFANATDATTDAGYTGFTEVSQTTVPANAGTLVKRENRQPALAIRASAP